MTSAESSKWLDARTRVNATRARRSPLLTIGYMISRGLAKSGSRAHYGADQN